MFTANTTGKRSLRTGKEVRNGELDKQVAQCIADSGATCHLTPDADGLTNYRECSRPLCLADRRKISIAGYDDLTVGSFQRQLGTAGATEAHRQVDGHPS